jgi:hypothetical protein
MSQRARIPVGEIPCDFTGYRVADLERSKFEMDRSAYWNIPNVLFLLDEGGNRDCYVATWATQDPPEDGQIQPGEINQYAIFMTNTFTSISYHEQIYLFDTSTKQLQVLTTPNEDVHGFGDYLWSPTGEYLVFHVQSHRSESEIQYEMRVFDLRANTQAHLLPGPVRLVYSRDSFRRRAWVSDDQVLLEYQNPALVSTSCEEPRSLYLADLRTQSVEPLVTDVCDMSRFEYNPTTRHATYDKRLKDGRDRAYDSSGRYISMYQRTTYSCAVDLEGNRHCETYHCYGYSGYDFDLPCEMIQQDER